MQYLMLLHSNPDYSDPDAFRRYQALAEEMRELGILIASEPLGPAPAARLVRSRDGETTVTDGPTQRRTSRSVASSSSTVTTSRRSRASPHACLPRASGRSRFGRSVTIEAIDSAGMIEAIVRGVYSARASSQPAL